VPVVHNKPLAAERICRLIGTVDPEGFPILNNCAAAGIIGGDLGIVVDHDTGDGRLYFFFGDSFVDEDRVKNFPSNGDCMARTDALVAGPYGPTLNFLYDVDDDGHPMPRALTIPNVSLGVYEVPTGGFSHNGKLYVFASTDHYLDPTPRTIDLLRNEDYMGRSVLASATDWRQFSLVPGHADISNHLREAVGEFKFINIAPWKIRNDDWQHLPTNATPGGQGLFLIGSGRFHTSRPCLAYVPLPQAADPVFSEWRYLSGYGPPQSGSGPCGTPLWSEKQRDAIFLWDDSPFYPSNHGPVPENKGVVGELSIAFIPVLGLWVALYDTKLRSSAHPWGPWSDPIDLFEVHRDHADPNDPEDKRPHYIPPDGFPYGPYIVPRFTEYEPVTGVATLYYVMSMGIRMAMLMRTRVRLECSYRDRFTCAQRAEISDNISAHARVRT
jgi:hypothetical protein